MLPVVGRCHRASSSRQGAHSAFPLQCQARLQVDQACQGSATLCCQAHAAGGGSNEVRIALAAAGASLPHERHAPPANPALGSISTQCWDAVSSISRRRSSSSAAALGFRSDRPPAAHRLFSAAEQDPGGQVQGNYVSGACCRRLLQSNALGSQRMLADADALTPRRHGPRRRCGRDRLWHNQLWCVAARRLRSVPRVAVTTRGAAVALWRNHEGKAEVLQLDEEDDSCILPSVVAFVGGDPVSVSGNAAVELRSRFPRCAVSNVKRFVGRKPMDPEVQDLVNLSAVQLQQSKGSEVRFSITRRDGNIASYGVLEVAALLFSHLRVQCKRVTGVDASRAVVTVPGSRASGAPALLLRGGLTRGPAFCPASLQRTTRPISGL